jgi:hypothetical protein
LDGIDDPDQLISWSDQLLIGAVAQLVFGAVKQGVCWSLYQLRASFHLVDAHLSGGGAWERWAAFLSGILIGAQISATQSCAPREVFRIM